MKDTERLLSRAEVLLAKVGTILQCERKETIYSQGSAARGLYYVQKGMVMLTVQSKHRRPVIVAVLDPVASLMRFAS